MLHRRRAAALPPRRIVVEFRLRGGRRSLVWLVLDPHGVSEVCLKDPGFPVDLVVGAEVRAIFRLWVGRLRRADAERRNLVKMEGPRDLVRAFPEWFDWPQVPPAAGHAKPLHVRVARRTS